MFFSVETQNKIKTLFKNDDEMQEKLLSGNADAIRNVGMISQTRINPEDVVEAVDSKDPDIMSELYIHAKRLVELQKLYRELCLEFEENTEIMSQTNNQKKTI